MNSSFRESWLIPKNLILDYIQYKVEKEEGTNNFNNETVQNDGGGGGEEKSRSGDDIPTQQGGAMSTAATTDPASFYKKQQPSTNQKKSFQLPPSTRMKLVKNYLNQDSYQKQQMQDNSMAPTTALSRKKRSSVPKINLEMLYSHFPEAERYKISYVITFINLKLPYQVQVDRGLNLIIEGNYIWDSSLTDVLKFLFGIDRRYLTEHRTVTDRNIIYGIPKGTEELIEVLQTQQPVLTRLGFNPFRLKLLFEDNMSSEDEGTTIVNSTALDDDDGDGGGGGGNDDENQDDDDDDYGGGAVGGENNPDLETPENRRGRSAKRSIIKDPYFNRGQSLPPSSRRSGRRRLINQEKEGEEELLLPPATPATDVQPEIEEVFQQNKLPSYLNTGELADPTETDEEALAPVLDGFLFNSLNTVGKSKSSQLHSLDRWTSENHGRKQQREMDKLKIASTSSFAPKEGKRKTTSKLPLPTTAVKRKSLKDKGLQEKNSVKFSSAEKKISLSRKGTSPDTVRKK